MCVYIIIKEAAPLPIRMLGSQEFVGLVPLHVWVHGHVEPPRKPRPPKQCTFIIDTPGKSIHHVPVKMGSQMFLASCKPVVSLGKGSRAREIQRLACEISTFSSTYHLHQSPVVSSD